MFYGIAEPREADTRPPGQPTRLAHPRCYAASLDDCSDEISGEHFLSQDVLREMDDKAVWIRGFHWQPAAPMRVGIGSLEANVLCRRHNSALSKLDEQAGRLFRTLRAVDTDYRRSRTGTALHLFPVIDVERWLLKCLMGLMAAGNARATDAVRFSTSPPLLWSQILFSRWGFPTSWGLYVKGRVGEGMNLDGSQVSLAPLTTDGEISGLITWVAGVELTLLMRTVRGGRRTGAVNDDSIFRPNELLFEFGENGGSTSVCFAWRRGKKVGGQVRIGPDTFDR